MDVWIVQCHGSRKVYCCMDGCEKFLYETQQPHSEGWAISLPDSKVSLSPHGEAQITASGAYGILCPEHSPKEDGDNFNGN